MTDTVRAGVSIPYSPEFAEMESNPALLEKIGEMTGGKKYEDNAKALEEAAAASEVFRPVPQSHASLQTLWPWMVFLAGLCLLFDVATRRIAIQPELLWTKSVALWQRLRGRAAVPEKTAEFLERLKSRKAKVSEGIDKQKAAVKFEPGAATPVKPIDGPTVVSPVPEKPKPAPTAPPPKSRRSRHPVDRA